MQSRNYSVLGGYLRPAVGFTLIEMLIAIALGSSICYTAFAGLRVCSQSVTLVNRLSQENRMLRCGFSAALDDLDFWTSYDDPNGNPANQPLRGYGNPFYHGPETTFAGAEADFDQDEARNWWRGAPTACNIDFISKYTCPDVFSGVAHPNPDASRLPKFLKRVPAALGYCAMFDICPANTIYSFIDTDNRVPKEFWDYQCSTGYLSFSTSGWWDPTDAVPRDMSATRNSLFVITKDPSYVAGGVSRHRFNIYCALPWDNATWGYGVYMPIRDQVPSLPIGPEHWPTLEIDTRHFVCNYRQRHTASITVASPLSGSELKLFLSTTSTTLRGARRQRWLDQ